MSLTPHSWSRVPDQEELRGLGAPLWVILTAVAGAAIFTVSLIVNGITDDLAKLNDVIDERMKSIVLHQFYLLFAPLGAILVYQAMIITGTADKAVTVGVGVLAAGLALNSVLASAVSSVQGLFMEAE